MQNKIDIAVLGATGAVGETILEILAERKFPVNNIYALASERSVGEHLRFANRTLDVIDVATFDFSIVQLALFSAGSNVSAIYAPKAAAMGCVVIDNTSCFRNEIDIPLVIPEVNPEKIKNFKNRNIIANPNCSTIQMLVALNPIYNAVGIKKINVATYQSVSGTGKAAISELVQQTALLLNGKPVAPRVYSKQIAYNVIPHIDDFLDNGYTKEEMKMLWETRKIFNDPKIIVNASAVRVPVIYGHSEAISIETIKPISANEVRDLLATAPGVKLLDKPKDLLYPTAIHDAAGKNEVFVGRIRNGIDEECTINLWVVSDNVRKGAALNAVQIAEILVKTYF